jgi:hypothetical protein
MRNYSPCKEAAITLVASTEKARHSDSLFVGSASAIFIDGYERITLAAGGVV